MFFQFLFCNLQDIIRQNQDHPVLGEVLKFHKRWSKENLRSLKALKKSTPKGYECEAKQLIEEEIVAINSITDRNQPRWTDNIWDFFGKRTSARRFSINTKMRRVAEFLEYAQQNFDRLNKIKLDGLRLGSGIFSEDMMVTHDALALKLVLLFQKIAAKQDISEFEHTPVLYTFDTQEFDFSGSVFSKKNAFMLPHNGYILSGQREQAARYRWGPEDCGTLIIKYFPELPENGFTTLILWKWLDKTLETDQNFADYRYMIPILERVFKPVDDFKPGDFLLRPGHIWFVLGKEGDSLYLMNYHRQDLPDQGNGFMIRKASWEEHKKDWPKYAILRPQI
ncbi:MAG: hypothetical protein H6850_02090 [Alphaproteobacteria bacterium]|nr:MAG: hypothetical protein H6850_02090 [Alphaproteobacteria bacterium]